MKIAGTDFERLANAACFLPVHRLTSLAEAEGIVEQLAELDITAHVVDESVLRLSRECRNIRAFRFADTSLFGIGKRETLETKWEEISLMVQGRLFTHRFEEEQNKKGRRTQLIDKREFSTDEAVLDIYTAADEANWRIRAGNFDYSCLADAKRATTLENFALLIALLRSRIKGEFDNSYIHSRGVLDSIWPPDQTISTNHAITSVSRKFNLATTRIIDNQAQFTRYSRLRRYLTNGTAANE